MYEHLRRCGAADHHSILGFGFLESLRGVEAKVESVLQMAATPWGWDKPTVRRTDRHNIAQINEHKQQFKAGFAVSDVVKKIVTFATETWSKQNCETYTSLKNSET